MNEQDLSEEVQQHPAEIDEIVVLLERRMMLFLLAAALFGVIAMIEAATGNSVSSRSVVESFFGGALIAIILALFLGILARNFRALKSWSYGYVDFLVAHSGILIGTRTNVRRKLRQERVRRAFGIDVRNNPD
jgi:membrane protein YdbS with pleckstrin-like domain